MAMPGWFQLPRLHPQVWILVLGRFISQIGTGIVLFYVPLYFVNQVGLSATAVGGALSSAALASVVGYVLAGTLVDTPGWGRRRTLMAACGLSILADGVFWVAHSLPLLILANVLLGLGDSLYWPASGAAIADLTQDQDRDTAFALFGLADSLAAGVGIVMGGLIIRLSGSYGMLFWLDGVTFLAFLTVLALKVQDSQPTVTAGEGAIGPQAWWSAISNPRLAIFATANILFTTYMNWMESTLPLYFTRFMGHENRGLAADTVGLMFSGYVLLVALAQLPLVRRLSAFQRVDVLRISMLLWGVGFGLVALTPILPWDQWLTAVGALAILAIANITYNPFAVALVSDLAPARARGIYLSLNAQCWSVGYLVGPLIGGWAIDQPPMGAHQLWLMATLSTWVGIGILTYLKRLTFPPS
jgi:MFS family permease